MGLEVYRSVSVQGTWDISLEETWKCYLVVAKRLHQLVEGQVSALCVSGNILG